MVMKVNMIKAKIMQILERVLRAHKAWNLIHHIINMNSTEKVIMTIIKSIKINSIKL